ncbi:MAG: hypothetical protein LBJ63_00035 [Prevotellaceae bacterium]|jgi:hypothetical protein|nr:hypothetical protein [Prevotellaceae bacterium]
MHTTAHTPESREKMRISHLGKSAPWNRKEGKVVNGIMLYKCSSCGNFMSADFYYKSKRNPIGITSQCKKCHIKTSIATRSVEKERERAKLRARRIRIENPGYFKKYEKVKKKTYKTLARYMLNKAIKNRIITKPNFCESCGRDNVRITAHHSDYSEPLRVEWLCYECHAKIHRKLIK